MYNIMKLDDEKDMDYVDYMLTALYNEASLYMEFDSEEDLPKFIKEIHKLANLRSGANVFVASGKLLNESYELSDEHKFNDNHIFAFVNPSYLCNRVKGYESKLASSNLKQFRELNDYLNSFSAKEAEEDEYFYGNDLNSDFKRAFGELLNIVNKRNDKELSNCVENAMKVLSWIYAKNCDIQSDLEELEKKYN